MLAPWPFWGCLTDADDDQLADSVCVYSDFLCLAVSHSHHIWLLEIGTADDDALLSAYGQELTTY
jgi:hypothetical protein